MNNNTNKYFYLMALLMGTVVAIAGIIALVFYILKLFAVTFSNIPGTGFVFQLFIVMAPYLILFAAYYLVHKKIAASLQSLPAIAARILLTIGSLLCITGLALSLLVFFKVKAHWLTLYNEYGSHTFALHVILIFISAGILATADPKEKSWLERQ